MMRIVLALALPLMLGGCFSYSESPPPAHTTVVVPQGSAPGTACPNGAAPPC